MKKYLISLIILLQITANSQEKITIIPKWQDKETKTLLKFTKWCFVNTVMDDTIRYADTVKTISLLVIKKNNSYDLLWNPKNKEYKNELDKKYVDKLFFDIKLNEKGEFQEVQNKEYLYKTLIDYKKELIKSLKKEGADKKEIKKINSNFNKTNFNFIKIDAKIKSETSFFFSIYGKTIIINDTVHYEDKTKGEITVTAKRIDENHILIKEIYTTEFELIIEEVIAEEIDGEYEVVEEKTFDEALSDIENDAKNTLNYTEYTYNTKTGWLELVSIYEYDTCEYTLTKYILK